MVRFQIELENRLAAGEELTELTIDELLHKYRSAQDKFLTESFGTIAAYGPNAAMMHYHATEEDHAKLEKKGFLLVDSGATYMDGTTDITRTYPLGELTADERLSGSRAGGGGPYAALEGRPARPAGRLPGQDRAGLHLYFPHGDGHLRCGAGHRPPGGR